MLLLYLDHSIQHLPNLYIIDFYSSYSKKRGVFMRMVSLNLNSTIVSGFYHRCTLLHAQAGTPFLCEVRAEGWSELSPRCVGAAARRAGLSPLFCDAPISRRPVCFLMHTLPPFGPAELGGFFLEFLRTDSEFGASRPLRERIRGHRGSISLRSFFSRH